MEGICGQKKEDEMWTTLSGNETKRMKLQTGLTFL
jgi:hypothetical protein